MTMTLNQRRGQSEIAVNDGGGSIGPDSPRELRRELM